MEMRAANGNSIKVLGAAILLIRGKSKTGDLNETHQLVYVTNETNQFFVSKGACIDLGIIPSDFPTIAGKHHETMSTDFIASASAYLNQQAHDEDPSTQEVVIC